MVNVYQMEATSLFLAKTLMSQYSRLRRQKLPKAAALTQAQLLSLASKVESVLEEPVPASCDRSQPFRFQAHLIVAFLTWILPQRTQVEVPSRVLYHARS
jgi:hypothetical protein